MSKLPDRFSLERRSIRLTLLGLLLTLTGWLMIDSLRRETVTYDEPLHLVSGYAFWKFDDYRLQVSHGALPQRLFALPLLGENHWQPDRSAPEWRKPDYLGINAYPGFLYGPGTNTAALIWRGRLVAVAIALLAVVAVYAWASRLFNPRAGLVAACCCALSPTFLAHGRLMTSDLVSALFFLMSAGCTGLLLRKFTWPRLAASTVCFGLLAVSKMSGPLFTLVALLMFVLRIVLRRPWPVRLAGVVRGNVRSLGGKAALACAAALAHGLVAFLIIWSLYGWQQKPAPGWDPVLDDYTEPRAEVLRGLGPTQPVFDVLERWKILPDAYLYGLAHTVKNSGQRPSYLNGDYSMTGWWFYFPYAFFVKSSPTELTFLGLGALGLILSCARPWGRRRLMWLDRMAPLWTLVLVYGLAALATNLNIGHRHLLPVYFPLFILAGAIGASLWQRGRWERGLLALLLVGQAVTTASIHPHYLAYFNAFAGGPDHGYRHLSDSNVDWGQDLPGLARWLETHASETNYGQVYVRYFGVDLPERLGIKARPLPGISNPRLSLADPCAYTAGTYCISATALIDPGAGQPAWNEASEKNYLDFLAALKEADRSDPPRRDDPANRKRWADRLNQLAAMQWGRLRSHLIERKPDAMIGYSILIYRISDAELRSATLP